MSEKIDTLMDEWIDWWSGKGSDGWMVELIKKSKYHGFALFYQISALSHTALMFYWNIIHQNECYLVRPWCYF